jgi:hypothetical protein
MVWALLSAGQGFVIGHFTGIFGFRSQPLLTKLAYAMPISISVVPCLYYLAARIGGINAIHYLNLGFGLLLLIIFARRWHYIKQNRDEICRRLVFEIRSSKFILLAAAIWLCLGCIVLIDLQIDHKLFISMPLYDHSLRVALADSISREGLPPSNPVYWPGHSVQMLYHYYWVLLCIAVSQPLGHPYNNRITVLAGVLWTGLVFLAFLGAFARFFRGRGPSLQHLVSIMMLLLLATDLYILYALPVNLMGLHFKHAPLVPVVFWWTDNPITAPLFWMIWEPHYLSALIAGMMSSILILKAGEQLSLKERVKSILIAAVCMSSAAGLNVYLVLGFAPAWIAWALVNLFQRNLVGFITTALTSAIGLALTYPLLLEFSSAHYFNSPIVFGVRKFEILDLIRPVVNSPAFVHNLIFFLALPLNYFLGMGFLSLGAILYWIKDRLPTKEPIASHEQFLLILAAITFLEGSFLRNGTYINAFGIWVIMPMQLATLLWSAEFLSSGHRLRDIFKLSKGLSLLLVLSCSSCVYGLYLERTSASFRIDSKRAYSIRQIYQFLDQSLPENAVIQAYPGPSKNYFHESEFFGVQLYPTLYSHRRTVIDSNTSGANSGPDPKEYDLVRSQIEKLFNEPSLSEAIAICHHYKINVILLTTTDRMWASKSAWVKTYPVIAANDHAQAFLVNPDYSPFRQ